MSPREKKRQSNRSIQLPLTIKDEPKLRLTNRFWRHGLLTRARDLLKNFDLYPTTSSAYTANMSKKPMRLVNLPALKVKKPILHKQTNTCIVLMTSLLNCWASNGEGNAACLDLESDLKNCMNNKVSTMRGRSYSNVAYSLLTRKMKLSRNHPSITMPRDYILVFRARTRTNSSLTLLILLILCTYRSFVGCSGWSVPSKSSFCQVIYSS